MSHGEVIDGLAGSPENWALLFLSEMFIQFLVILTGRSTGIYAMILLTPDNRVSSYNHEWVF